MVYIIEFECVNTIVKPNSCSFFNEKLLHMYYDKPDFDKDSVMGVVI